MNPFLFLLAAINTAVGVAEALTSDKKAGKKKKKAVVDNVSAVIKEGVNQGTLRGSWDQVTPDVVGALVELAGEAKGLFSKVVSVFTPTETITKK